MANLWTEEELRILKEKYPVRGTNIPTLLKRHTPNSIMSKAKKLNITYGRYNKWSEEEVNILKKYYPVKGTNIPDLTSKRDKKSIKDKAHNIGLKKEKKNK